MGCCLISSAAQHCFELAEAWPSMASVSKLHWACSTVIHAGPGSRGIPGYNAIGYGGPRLLWRVGLFCQSPANKSLDYIRQVSAYLVQSRRGCLQQHVDAGRCIEWGSQHTRATAGSLPHGVCHSVGSVGELVAAAAAAASPPGGAHAVMTTVTQVAVTAAAVAYGAYLGENIIRPESALDPPAPIKLEGVDVTSYPIFMEAEVQRAIEFARECHAGQVRKTGEAYITHCIHTARILAALVPSRGQRAIDTLVAGVLHDTIDDTPATLHQIRSSFGEDVARLVEGVSKLSQINQLLRRHRRRTTGARDTPGSLSPSDVDNLRLMLLGMVNDPRVVLIKLADRLHNMRTIYALAPAKAAAVAHETLAVWCSLASRLGVWAVKAELEDLCFAVLQPQTFQQLRAELADMWSRPEEWRSMRRGSKRRSRHKLETPEQPLRAKLEPVSTKELLEAVVPFDVLLDRERRFCSLGGRVPGSSKAVRDAELALSALGACEEALSKELLITTPYVPGMEITLSGRLKSLYSAHCKMRRKGCTLDQVYDARALRVVVGDAGGALHVAAVESCYDLLSVVHSLWTPVGGEFDDYILNPKPSGYQSLHTAVSGPDGAPLEVQIRTQSMHEYAEYGHAAHWLYKEGDAPGPVQPLPARHLQDALQYDPQGRSDDTITSVSAASSSAASASWSLGNPIETGGGRNFQNGHQSSLPVEEQEVRRAHPALRVQEGRLLAAVVMSSDESAKSLLVGVSFGVQGSPAVAAGRSGNQRRRWETYARLYARVAGSWWNAPGHGDWSTCLEKYTLCSDGIYHKQDQFGRALPTFLQLLDMSAQEQVEYDEVVDMVQRGCEVSFQADDVAPSDSFALVRPSTMSLLNQKVRLLRSMLQWEQEVRHEAAGDESLGQSSLLAEVLVIRWPGGEIVRMSSGSTAADAARAAGMEGYAVRVNGIVVLPNTELRDGDSVDICG